MNGLFTLFDGQAGDGHPNELEGGGGVLAAGVADDPRHLVGEVEFANLRAEGVHGGLEPLRLKSRWLPRGGRRFGGFAN